VKNRNWSGKPNGVSLAAMLMALAPRGSLPIVGHDQEPPHDIPAPKPAAKLYEPPKCGLPGCDDRAKGGKAYCGREHAIAHRELDRARRLRGSEFRGVETIGMKDVRP
jgi:hypothetical protein